MWRLCRRLGAHATSESVDVSYLCAIARPYSPYFPTPCCGSFVRGLGNICNHGPSMAIPCISGLYILTYIHTAIKIYKQRHAYSYSKLCIMLGHCWGYQVPFVRLSRGKG